MKRLTSVNRATRAQERRGWYRITNSAGDGDRPASIHLFDEIGFWGMSAADFIGELKAISSPTIDLRVNSPGGEIFDGYAIYNALSSHPAEITAYVDALAASAASFIVQAADKIIVQETSQMMIHDGIGFVFGNARDMREQAGLLEKLSDQIANIYAARTGTDVEHWRDQMLAETWYTAQEAVDAGLADEVAPMKRRANATNNALADDVLSQLWDLSAFRYAGRGAAPAPTIVTKDEPAPVEPNDPFASLLQDHSMSSTVDDNPLAALGR
jgi:ATP-dependent Clp endopeptidase proteolytic subunit ClpP